MFRIFSFGFSNTVLSQELYLTFSQHVPHFFCSPRVFLEEETVLSQEHLLPSPKTIPPSSTALCSSWRCSLLGTTKGRTTLAEHFGQWRPGNGGLFQRVLSLGVFWCFSRGVQCSFFCLFYIICFSVVPSFGVFVGRLLPRSLCFKHMKITSHVCIQGTPQQILFRLFTRGRTSGTRSRDSLS